MGKSGSVAGQQLQRQGFLTVAQQSLVPINPYLFQGNNLGRRYETQLTIEIRPTSSTAPPLSSSEQFRTIFVPSANPPETAYILSQIDAILANMWKQYKNLTDPFQALGVLADIETIALIQKAW